MSLERRIRNVEAKRGNQLRVILEKDVDTALAENQLLPGQTLIVLPDYVDQL